VCGAAEDGSLVRWQPHRESTRSQFVMALVATVVRLESRIEQALLELTTAAGADAEASGEGFDTAQVQRSAQKLDHARRMMRELAALVEVRPCGLVVRPQGMG